jgi:hypothetical protein
MRALIPRLKPGGNEKFGFRKRLRRLEEISSGLCDESQREEKESFVRLIVDSVAKRARRRAGRNPFRIELRLETGVCRPRVEATLGFGT